MPVPARICARPLRDFPAASGRRPWLGEAGGGGFDAASFFDAGGFGHAQHRIDACQQMAGVRPLLRFERWQHGAQRTGAWKVFPAHGSAGECSPERTVEIPRTLCPGFTSISALPAGPSGIMAVTVGIAIDESGGLVQRGRTPYPPSLKHQPLRLTRVRHIRGSTNIPA